MTENEIKAQAYAAAKELIEAAGLKAGRILVVGCSTSEVCGASIGKGSDPQTAGYLFDGINEACREYGVYIAAQCCEHLNRAIVTEAEALPGIGTYFGPEPVNVVPQPKAGGSFAYTAYNRFKNPVVVEEIKADAGLDIGDTLIGMHLKRVAVPVRLKNNTIGHARVIAAGTRPKYIGGERAVYDEKLNLANKEKMS